MNDRLRLRLRLLLFPLVVAGLGLAAGEAKGTAMANLTSAASMAAVLQDSGPRIAVVDAERLWTESHLGRSVTERFTTFQAEEERRVAPLQQEFQQLTEALQAVSPDSPQARDYRRQRQILQSRLQTEQQVFVSEANYMIRQGNVRLLRAIETAVSKVARDKGYALVIRKSPSIPSDLDLTSQAGGEQLERIISRNVTLYVDPSIDITSLVLTQMNADFEAGGGEIPAAPTGPTTAPAGPPSLDLPTESDDGQ